MLRQFYNLLGEPAAEAMRCRLGGLVRICFYGLYTLSTTCDAATLAPQSALTSNSTTGAKAERHQQLSEVWREAFPSTDDELAPSSLAYSFPPSKPAAPWTGVPRRTDRPHPAVARIVVPEEGAISYGSGTLIDVRENFGLVITNWHVVRDATGTIEVVFPNGFNSKARALKVDTDWDLAALVVWRHPGIEPVPIAASAPQPGDRLTICGYGQGNYRCASGHCTQYYAPRLDFPRHMVELDVEARQGDSGGPIFNDRGELAGVLFGAGQGTTLGSFGGRVNTFLATLAPDIGRAEQSLAENSVASPQQSSAGLNDAMRAAATTRRAATLTPTRRSDSPREFASEEPIEQPKSAWPTSTLSESPTSEPTAQLASLGPPIEPDDSQPAQGSWSASTPKISLFEQTKTALAAVGLVTVVVQMLRVAR